MSHIAQDIDELLNDKLFQVIGSTPASIAESLAKVGLKGQTKTGAQMFAACIFASAVNKSTLETFLADPRFADVRPVFNAAMSISGRSNMTALTLMGHCFLTTSLAGSIKFSSEFRKKMGQDHLWAGNLESGSLSDKQKEILREKKRITSEDDAKALGSGFLKHTGIVNDAMTQAEMALFGGIGSSTGNSMPPPSAPPTIPAASRPSAYASASSSRFGSRSILPTSSPGRKTSDPVEEDRMVTFTTQQSGEEAIPESVLNYRRNMLLQSDADISESISRNGTDSFIRKTRTLMNTDPDGSRTRAASTIGRQ